MPQSVRAHGEGRHPGVHLEERHGVEGVIDEHEGAERVVVREGHLEEAAREE